MSRIIINQLGPIQSCDLEIDEFMVFTGPQSSGKSTIAKSVFLFKNVKNILVQLLRKQHLLSEGAVSSTIGMSLKNRLIRELRSNFLQIFGTIWCMDHNMSLKYEYREDVWIQISLKDDQMSPNYIWLEFSQKLIDFLGELDEGSGAGLLILNFDIQDTLKQTINRFFADELEIVYIPAGRSMMTLLSTQLNYICSLMDDLQRRSMDYCTQNYIERILQLKPSFPASLEELMKNRKELTDQKLNVSVLKQAIGLMKRILRGEYRNIDGEERLQVSANRYVKINFASSGQQEAVWILNVLFYYLLQGRKAYFIVEEPESHLYPDAQKLITEFIVLVKNAGNQAVLTTHSPYILGTLNNLLYANKISKQVEQEKLHRIINRDKWLDFEKLSAYYVRDGQCRSCVDLEFESIENEMIDGASEDINRDYDQMLALNE